MAELHDGIAATHDDIRGLTEIMRRSKRTADKLLTDLGAATAWLRQINDEARCG